VDRTPAQTRTLEGLIGVGPGPAFPSDLSQRLRDRLEEAVSGLELSEPLWLSKHLLGDRRRCEGLFQAGLAREGPPFSYSVPTAAGALFHRAIQLDVGSEGAADPRTVVERAADRLDERPAFGGFWRGLDALDRGELITEGMRALVLFRERFPPLERHWQPVPEQRLRADLAGGSVVLSGQVDLILGRRQRLVLDFKTGDPRPEYPEDMRFYALLVTLSLHAPPYRVATVFLESGEWQMEEVSEETLDHAAHRVIEGARAAVALRRGRAPNLSPGPFCGWCPRGATCPESTVRLETVTTAATPSEFPPSDVA
jgi:PD-(D/E)XK nuclease superfamily